MANMGEERRKHVRIFLPGGQVRISSGELMVLVGKVVNISVGGIQFFCNFGLNIGDEIDLELTLPTGVKYRCSARIVHSEKSGSRDHQVAYGSQFLNLGVREQQELGDYIAKKRAEPDKMRQQE